MATNPNDFIPSQVILDAHTNPALTERAIAKEFIPSQVILDELPDGQMLSAEQAAQAIGSKPATLSVWRCTKRVIIPYHKVGRRVVYKAGDLKAFMRSRSIDGDAA